MPSTIPYICSTSATSEHVESLHRMIDEAQEKLRCTRKKLEERIKALKNFRSNKTVDGNNKNHIESTGSAAIDHNRRVTATSQSHATTTVPNEVNLDFIFALPPSAPTVDSAGDDNNSSTDRYDEVNIDYNYIASLVSAGREVRI